MSDEESGEPEVKAISALIAALKPLDPDARAHVLEFVLKRLGISLSSDAPLAADVASAEPPGPPISVTDRVGIDIRTFAAEKAPATVNEKVAVIAYYLTHLTSTSERRDYIAPADIKPYFVQAGFPLPTAPPSMTLLNAKNAGYLNAMDRGQYSLNAVGHNLVAHKLPSRGKDETHKPAKKARKPSKKKARSKSKK